MKHIQKDKDNNKKMKRLRRNVLLGLGFGAAFSGFGLMFSSKATAVQAEPTASEVYTVTDYGAVANDEESDWQAIQSCLDFAKNNDGHSEVRIPAGKYYIDNILKIYSDTSLVLDKNAEIIRLDGEKLMLMTPRDEKIGGYNQAHDITVEGGKWNGNVKDTNIQAGILYFGHAQNVTLKDCEVTDCCAKHMVTFAGVKDAAVSNVSFSDVKMYTGDPSVYNTKEVTGITFDSEIEEEAYKLMTYQWSMEALHLDCISPDAGSEPTAVPLDGTVNRNIIVENCSFTNVFSAVGSHYLYNDADGLGMVIKNNTFTDVKYTCVNVHGQKNATIEGNVAENVMELARVRESDNVLVKNNKYTGKGSEEDNKMNLSAVRVFDSDEVTVSGNDFENSPSVGIYATNTGLTAVGNTVSGTKSNGIYVSGSYCILEDNIISNNRLDGIGIVDASNAVSVKNNSISHITGHGIYTRSSRANITDNTIDEIGGIGITAKNTVLSVSGNTISEVRGAKGIYAYDKSEGTILENKLTNTGSGGIHVSDSEINITDNDVLQCNGFGIAVTDSAKCKAVSGNMIKGSVGNGIYIKQSNANVSDNDIISAQQQGIAAINGSDVTLKDNYIYSAGINGAYIQDSTADVSHNEIKKSVANGIYSKDSKIKISDNNIAESGENNNAIYMTETTKDYSEKEIINNTITDSATRGINLVGVSSVLIEGNIVGGSGNHGIHVKDSDQIQITDNETYDNEKCGIIITNTANVTVNNNKSTGSAVRDIYIYDDGVSGSGSGNSVGTKGVYDPAHILSGTDVTENVQNWRAAVSPLDLSFRFSVEGVNMYAGESLDMLGKILRVGEGETSYNWSTSDASVAEVDQEGNLYAKVPGTTVLTATPTGEENGISCTVTVLNSGLRVRYHKNENSAFDLKETVSEAGNEPTLTGIQELGYDRPGYMFDGWKIYRISDNKWLLKDAEGNESWETLSGEELPEGKTFKKINDGAVLSEVNETALLDLYATWKSPQFTIRYYADDKASASEMTTTVTGADYGHLYTRGELGFSKTGYDFAGWRIRRQSDNLWYVQDAEGIRSWMELPEEGLPEGYDFVTYADGAYSYNISADDDIDMYAQWEEAQYTIRYYRLTEGGPNPKLTQAAYWISTKTLTAEELEISSFGNDLAGWRVYREADDSWLVTNPEGNEAWVALQEGQLPDGYSYVTLEEGAEVVSLAEGGVVRFYAQWVPSVYTIVYHDGADGEALELTTKVTYGTDTTAATLAELGIERGADYTFAGWTGYRDYDDKWLLKDSDGNTVWMPVENGELPEGYTYALWGNGANVPKVTPKGTVHFYAQWRDKTFTVKYHEDEESEAAEQSTIVRYGTLTNTLTAADLGFEKEHKDFIGWKVYRTVDDSWYLKDEDGVNSFKKLENGELPAGHTYVLYKNGEAVKATASGGEVHLYGQWKDTEYTIRYHRLDTSAPFSKLTKLTYAQEGQIYTAAELGMTNYGNDFIGWKVYRESDTSWLLKAADGTNEWMKLNGEELPEGYEYAILEDGSKVKELSERDVVHLYAQWKPSTYTIKYHDGMGTGALPMETSVSYGTDTKLRTLSELGIERTPDYTFAGWAGYREYDDKWFVIKPDGSKEWMTLENGTLPEGYEFATWGNGANVPKVTPNGTAHFYALWKDKIFTVKYHEDEESEAVEQSTTVRYGTLTNTLTADELGLKKECYTFVGWKVYRDYDNKWYLKDSSGKNSFKELVDGKLPEGHSFVLYKNGEAVKATTPSGEVHFYGIWKPIPVKSISIEDTNLELEEEETYKLNVNVYPENAANKKITWSTADGTIAAIDQDGNITGIKPGNTKITATTEDGGYISEVNVVIKEISVKGIQLSEEVFELKENETFILVATIIPENAANKNIRWVSSDENIAVVDKDGKVMAKRQGNAIITAITEDGEKTAIAEINVKPEKGFTVQYHIDEESEASEQSTKVTYGTLTNTKTINELGFSKPNQIFTGWKAYRDMDDTWYLKDSNGKNAFKKLVNGQLPDGHRFVLYKNGESVKATASSGAVHFYAQWKEKVKTFDVVYHPDDSEATSNQITTVTYGTLTPTRTIEELGFEQAGYEFIGWKAYRDIDDTWYLKDANGKNAFKKLVNGQLPEGHRFVLYKNGESVKATASSGVVHFYAQWK